MLNADRRLTVANQPVFAHADARETLPGRGVIQASELRAGFRVWDLGFRVQGSGFRV